ncbi:MAG TPA: AAA family ATPase [Thermoleophilaceae bacterium]
MEPSDDGLVPKAAEEPTPGTLRDSSELLERAVHLSTLDTRVTDVASNSRGSLVLVSGEAGVGKTALLRRFCDGQGPTARVLWGTCDALFTPRPLGPLFEIAEATGGELEALVTGGGKAHEVSAALAREVARRPPAVVVLEDLQQADGATLDVIRLLARKAGTIPALLIASYREDELTAAHPLRIVLGELATIRELERLKLEPLSADAVAELARSHELDPDQLFRKTAGNPFFVTEVLAAGADAIPDTVRDAVLARAARLSTAARRLLEAVAIVPSHAELWLLEAIAADVVGNLEECLASGMLEAGPEGVAFRHELARLTVEESLAPDRKLALHRAALTELDRVPAESADLDRLAHHAAGAGDAGAVLCWAPPAAQRASSLGAHREAAAHYQRALRFAAALPGEERAALLEGRAYECYLTGELEDAIAAQERALVQRRGLPDGRAEGDCLRSLSRLYRFLGRTKEAEEVGREAVARLEESPPGRELAMAYVNLGHLYTVADAAEEALAWTSKAVALGERLDAPEARVYALTNFGAIEMLTGAEAPTKLEQSLDLALRAGLEENAGRAYLNLVWWPVRQRRYDVVDRYLQAGLDYCIERAWTCGACSSFPAAPAWSWTVAAGARPRIPRHSRSEITGPFPSRESLPCACSPWCGRDAVTRMSGRHSTRPSCWPSQRASYSGSGGSRRRVPKPRGWKASLGRSPPRPMWRSNLRCSAVPGGRSASSPAGAGAPGFCPRPRTPRRSPTHSRSAASGSAPPNCGRSEAAPTKPPWHSPMPTTRARFGKRWTSCSAWALHRLRRSSRVACASGASAGCPEGHDRQAEITLRT